MNAMTLARNTTERFRAIRQRVIEDGVLPGSVITDRSLSDFNWALDWVDQMADPERCAVIVVDEVGHRSTSYAQLTRYSNRVATFLDRQGASRGDRVLVLMRNSVEYYAVALGCMKLGMPVVPVFVDLQRAELEDRIRRARVSHIVTDSSLLQSLSEARPGGLRIVVGEPAAGWLSLEESDGCSERFARPRETRPDDPLMGYFTSGTTSLPKLVMHSHRSYAIGHLSSSYWHGLRRDDVHANVSSPGWAKHAWSSMFVPFSAEATALVFSSDRPDPSVCLDALERHGVNSFCAPPSYWRSLARTGLRQKPSALTQAVSAGESLDEGVSALVERAWGLTIRNGYGQSEATAMIGFAPGKVIVPGGLGYDLPGYPIVLVDPSTGERGDEGEICLDLEQQPVGLMSGYVDQTGEPALPPGRYYRTGDLARRDARGCYHLLGRGDDVFKSYDVRISPLEIERTLRAHPLLGDIAVFAITDEFGEPVPAAALVATAADHAESLVTDLLHWQCQRLSRPHRLVRAWAVESLPKTLSGKTNRAALRQRFTAEKPVSLSRSASQP
jgi:acetyl-CoA synthetase